LRRRAPFLQRMDGFDIPLRSASPLHTPAGLRRRAAEFLRAAAGARDPVAWRELHRLAELYLQRAVELEGAATPLAGNDNSGERNDAYG
jgi:hypothetical protein